MPYNNPNTTSKTINYLNKDFDTFKRSLINLAETYFPDISKDFTESSPGTMFIEMSSYIGDVLSFYTDAQIQEVFLNYAQERKNLFALAYNLGYRPVVTNPSSVILDVFQQIPSDSTNDYKPDFRYALSIQKNSTFLPNNNSGISFLTQNEVDFSFSSSFDPTEVSVYSIDTSNNKPEYYLLKKSVKAISATLKTRTFNVQGPQRFVSFNLEDTNIIGIQSIVDSENNIWTEVPYLAQETVFEEVPNNAANDPELKQYNNDVPYLLRTKKVPKRFITRFNSDTSLFIQFGAGGSGDDDTTILPNPDNVGLGIKDGRSLLDLSFDPSNFLYSKAYGEIPSNTTLTVTYLTGGGINSNFGPNTINRVGNLNTIQTSAGLNANVYNDAVESITCNNPAPATGGGPGDTAEDIRLNATANFNTQNRTVTKNDYLFRTLSLPNTLGKVSKAYILQDTQISFNTNKRIENPNALNLYVLGYDINKNLTNLPETAKINLSVYLDQHRLMTDSINIKDAYVINIGIEYEIITFPQYSNELILLNCNNALKDYFNIDKWQINQPIIGGNITSILYNIEGVQSVSNLKITNKVGVNSGYSQYRYDLEQATRDGVIYPSQDLAIFEVKYPNKDIKGRVKTI